MYCRRKTQTEPAICTSAVINSISTFGRETGPQHDRIKNKTKIKILSSDQSSNESFGQMRSLVCRSIPRLNMGFSFNVSVSLKQIFTESNLISEVIFGSWEEPSAGDVIRRFLLLRSHKIKTGQIKYSGFCLLLLSTESQRRAIKWVSPHTHTHSAKSVCVFVVLACIPPLSLSRHPG